MKVPYWLLRLLSMWEYICPACRKEVKKNSHRCPHCGERFPLAIRVPPSFLKNPKKLEEYVHKHVFPKVSQAHREYLTQFFTEIFAHGFEGGDFGEDPETGYAWTGTSGSPAVTSGGAHHGTYKADFDASGDTCNKVFTAQSTCHARIYFKVSVIPPNWSRISVLRLNGEGSYPNYIRLSYECQGTGAYRWFVAYGRPSQGETHVAIDAPEADTYYLLELRVVVDSENGEYRLYYEGEEIWNYTGIDTSGLGDINTLIIGPDNDFYSCTLSVDCVVVADVYIGPEEEVTLKTVTDSFSLSESVLRNKTLILSDSLGLADTLYGNKSLLLSDSASLSELVTVILGEVMKYVTDSVSSADAVSTPSRVLRALEAIGAVDNVAVNKVLQITETVSLAEIVEVGVGGVKKTKLFLILGDLAVQLTGD
jgi:DNA-directed RNA polymerase subunit RPC12/RpoP